jgi:hypothetical protein
MILPKKDQAWCLVLFFAGLLAAFGLCRQLGKSCASRNCFGSIKRFSLVASPSGNFFPTPSQMRALALERLQSPEQVLVIIGGSSTFLGVGQMPDELWSERLQEALGPQFCVVNLAQRGSPLAGSAMVVAEGLVKEGRPVIYVANTPHSGGPGIPDGDEPYRYIFWDGFYKNMLLDYPPRLERLRQLEQNRAERRELATRAWLNSRLYFEDLWTAVAYHYFATNWHSLVRGQMFRARKHFGDGETRAVLEPGRFAKDENRLVPQLSSHLQQCLREEKREPDAFLEKSNQHLRAEIDWAIPTPLRPYVLAVVVSNCPYYLRKLSNEQRAFYLSQMERAVAVYGQSGVRAAHVGFDFEDDDYKDFVHIAPSGGRKIVAALTPIIREMAGRLYATP